MAENPRIAWLIAFDAESNRLQCDDFARLNVKECKHLLTDSTQTLMRLRLEKRVRSNQVVEELRRLQDEGRIDKAWIEKRQGTNKDDAELHSIMLDGTPVELERIYTLEEDAFASGRSKKKKNDAQNKQTTPSLSSASTTPLISNECEEEEEEDDDDDEDDEENNDNADDEDIQSLVKSCMQDIQKSCMKVIQKHISKLEQQVLQQHKRSKKHHRRSPSPQPKAKPAKKPSGLEYNRPPVKLSFLRTASVSELYYSGVWVPEFDVDSEFVDRPNRESRFRSELPVDQYVEGYDIDDLTHDVVHPDIVHCKSKADALKRALYLHFVDQRPVRSAVTLYSLRKSSLDVLCYLKVFFIEYDIDDETTLSGPIPDRPRATATQLAIRGGLPVDWSPEGFYLTGNRFYEGYDIDDRKAEERGKRIQDHAMAMKQDIQKERKA